MSPRFPGDCTSGSRRWQRSKPQRMNRVPMITMAHSKIFDQTSKDRTQIDGEATAYVCRNFVCSAPVTDAGALEKLLDESLVPS